MLHLLVSILVQDAAPFMMIRLQKYAENPKLPNIFLFLDILVPKLNKIKAAKPVETSSPFRFSSAA